MNRNLAATLIIIGFMVIAVTVVWISLIRVDARRDFEMLKIGEPRRYDTHRGLGRWLYNRMLSRLLRRDVEIVDRQRRNLIRREKP